jgi:myosin heavy subunit
MQTDSFQINDIMRTLAGILHLGNVRFSHLKKMNSNEVDSEKCDIKVNLEVSYDFHAFYNNVFLLY